MPRREPCFEAGQLESLARALGHTDTGLSGTEIGQFLKQAGITDTDPGITKWQRIYNALVAKQNSDQTGNRVLGFINVALSPVRYAGKEAVFQARRRAVNVPLAFYGLQYTDGGKFVRSARAATLWDAESRADRLRTVLSQRNVEDDVLQFCKAELLQDNYFHAVLEATKSVASKVRHRTGLQSDGADLVQDAFGGPLPKLRINAFSTETEKGEQRGFANLLTGFFGTFRNPSAHAARIEWPIMEDDALDLLSLASYIHRRVNRSSSH